MLQARLGMHMAAQLLLQDATHATVPLLQSRIDFLLDETRIFNLLDTYSALYTLPWDNSYQSTYSTCTDEEAG